MNIDPGAEEQTPSERRGAPPQGDNAALAQRLIHSPGPEDGQKGHGKKKLKRPDVVKPGAVKAANVGSKTDGASAPRKAQAAASDTTLAPPPLERAEHEQLHSQGQAPHVHDLAQKLMASLETMRKPEPNEPPSWQKAWQASHPMPKDHTRLILALAAAGACAVLCWGGVDTTSSWMDNMATFGNEPRTATPSSMRDAYLADVQAGQEQVAGLWSPAMDMQRPAAVMPPKKPTRRTSPAKPSRDSEMPVSALGPIPREPEEEDTTDPEFRQFHGSARRYRTSSKKVAPTSPTSDPSVNAKPSSLGAVLHATLSNQLASNATGTMAKAILSRKAVVGGRTLNAGTELVGAIAGGDETRVFVDFTSLRLADGQTLAMVGRAADGKGRYGLLGRREISSRAVASVGLSTGRSMLSETGQILGGALGGIIGRGVATATSSAADKASRADRDEVVVIADRGAVFTVLIKRID